MRRQLAVALLFFLYSSLTVGNYSFAQVRQDYIITHEPSVNVRPCPRFTEECNAIYRLSAGTILLNGMKVRGDSYAGSDEWVRFDRDDDTIFIHSSLLGLAPPNSDLADEEQAHAWVALYNMTVDDQRQATASVILDLRVGANRLHVYVGGVECSNRVRIFEDVSTPLECNRPGEVWYLENIDRIHLIIERDDENDSEIELRCGLHNDSSDQQLIFACVYEEDLRSEVRVIRPSEHTPTPGATPSRGEDCGDFEYLGTESQRFRIFEDWLTCEHGLDDEGYHALPDNESRAAIWWDFVELACGADTSRHYWIIDFDDDWRCQQKAWPATEQPTSTPSQTQVCDDFEYLGTENQRSGIFEEWVDCEYGLDEYFSISDEERRIAIWWEFVELACGTDTATHFYYIDVDDNWRCKLDSWPVTEQPTPSQTLICDDFEYLGTENQRALIFKEWLECKHGIAGVDEFRAISDDARLNSIWWEFVELACGADTASHYYTIDFDDNWRCKRVEWSDNEQPTATPTGPQTSSCGLEALTGSVMNRIATFERWLECEHGLVYDAFWDLPDDRWADIWWPYVEAICGPDTASHYWDLDSDTWQCEQVSWDDHSACGPVELTGTRINRILIFEQWLTCEYDIDYITFLDTLNEDRQDDIWWEFIWIACGPDTEDTVWYLDEDWQCYKDELGQEDGHSA